MKQKKKFIILKSLVNYSNAAPTAVIFDSPWIVLVLILAVRINYASNREYVLNNEISMQTLNERGSQTC